MPRAAGLYLQVQSGGNVAGNVAEIVILVFAVKNQVTAAVDVQHAEVFKAHYAVVEGNQ